MSAQTLHSAPKNRKALTPRPAWSYRGARRNAIIHSEPKRIWGPEFYMPSHPTARRRITGNRS